MYLSLFIWSNAFLFFLLGLMIDFRLTEIRISKNQEEDSGTVTTVV